MGNTWDNYNKYMQSSNTNIFTLTYYYLSKPINTGSFVGTSIDHNIKDDEKLKEVFHVFIHFLFYLHSLF